MREDGLSRRAACDNLVTSMSHSDISSQGFKRCVTDEAATSASTSFVTGGMHEVNDDNGIEDEDEDEEEEEQEEEEEEEVELVMESR